jgi:hypothetical protein
MGRYRLRGISRDGKFFSFMRYLLNMEWTDDDQRLFWDVMNWNESVTEAHIEWFHGLLEKSYSKLRVPRKQFFDAFLQAMILTNHESPREATVGMLMQDVYLLSRVFTSFTGDLKRGPDGCTTSRSPKNVIIFAGASHFIITRIFFELMLKTKPVFQYDMHDSGFIYLENCVTLPPDFDFWAGAKRQARAVKKTRGTTKKSVKKALACGAPTENGRKCKRRTFKGQKYCWQHLRCCKSRLRAYENRSK